MFFDVFIKGIIIGLSISVPLGPLGMLCIQRTLNRGQKYGIVTGVGATFSGGHSSNRQYYYPLFWLLDLPKSSFSPTFASRKKNGALLTFGFLYFHGSYAFQSAYFICIDCTFLSVWISQTGNDTIWTRVCAFVHIGWSLALVDYDYKFSQPFP